MTRINSAINVKNLTDEHLLAEHREIKRLPALYLKTNKTNIPKHFCLGTGHVKFFLNKFKFTYNRYVDIYNECLARGFNVEDYRQNWFIININDFNDYQTTPNEYNLLIERITDRILNSKKKCFHYYGKSINKQEAIQFLNNI
jgi:hypothetical protein